MPKAKGGVAVDESILDQLLANGATIISGDATPVKTGTASELPVATTPDQPQAETTVKSTKKTEPAPPPQPLDNWRKMDNWRDYAIQRAARAEDWLAAQPTPGGSGAVLLVIIILLWAIIPVNEQQKTRLQLLFYTLTGRTRLEGEREPTSTVVIQAENPQPTPTSTPGGDTPTPANVVPFAYDFSQFTRLQ